MRISEALIKYAQFVSPFDQEAQREASSPTALGMTIAKYLKDNSEPDAKKFSEWVLSSGIDPEESLDVILVLAARFARLALGGESEGVPPKGMNTEEFQRGIEVEMEHTPDRLVAAKIALDHLVEHPEYYTALDRMESDLKTGGAKSFMERIKTAAIVPKRPMKRKIARVRAALKSPLRSEQLPESRASFDQFGRDLGAE